MSLYQIWAKMSVIMLMIVNLMKISEKTQFHRSTRQLEGLRKISSGDKPIFKKWKTGKIGYQNKSEFHCCCMFCTPIRIALYIQNLMKTLLISFKVLKIGRFRQFYDLLQQRFIYEISIFSLCIYISSSFTSNFFITCVETSDLHLKVSSKNQTGSKVL